MEWVSMDGTHVRAHQSSAGAAGGSYQDIAKSVAGNSSKIHLAVDAHGNPVDFLISDGVTHDSKIAPNLLSLLDLTKTEVVNADRGYDSKELRHLISATQTHPNIAKKKNSESGNTHMDWHIYKARHVIENTFATLKHFRSIATRFDKLKNSYTNNVALACAYIWLRL